MSVLKDISNKVKKSEINTEGDVLDIKGTLKKNKFILDDSLSYIDFVDVKKIY